MPTVTVEGRTFTCETGANLRQVLLANQGPVYNGAAQVINCHGLGTCGTCAVEIEGPVSEMGQREKMRLSLPPHNLQRNRRLACQTKVLGDITVIKHGGLWGQADSPR